MSHPPAAPGPAGAWVSAAPTWLAAERATWSLRVVAAVVDSAPLLVGLTALLTGYLLALFAAVRTRVLAPVWAAAPGWLLAGCVVTLLGLGWTAVNRWWLAGRTGESLGRRLVGLQLVGAGSGTPIGGRQACLRDLVHLLDAVTVVGYLWPLADPERQTFADKLVRTVVNRRR